MQDKPTKYAAVIGLRATDLEELFRRFDAPTNRDHEMRIVSNIHSSSNSVRTATVYTDLGRLTITDHQAILGSQGFTLEPDERFVILQAEGPHVLRAWTTIAEGTGLAEDDVILFENLKHRFDLPPALGVGLLGIEAANSYVALARWRTLRFRPPLFIAHAANVDDARKAQKLFERAVPAFVRQYTLALIVPTPSRDNMNALLRTSPDDIVAEMNSDEPLGQLIPYRGAAVLAGSPIDAESDAIRALAKAPLDSRDTRKLTKALLDAMAELPDLTEIVSAGFGERLRESASLPIETDTAVDRALQEALGALERAQETIRAREETITALRRELRLAQYANAEKAADEPDPVENADDAALAQDAAPGPAQVEQPTLFEQFTPTTFAELFDLAREHLPLVVLPEKVDTQVAELVGAPKTSRWVSRTWAILTTMQQYAQERAAGAVPGNLRTYMSTLPHPSFPPNQVSLNESELLAKNRKFATERTFAVPTEVDATGWVLMEAHVRVDSGGKYPAPRLYFLDHTGGSTGQVFVGYIGPHLTNFRTT